MTQAMKQERDAMKQARDDKHTPWRPVSAESPSRRPAGRPAVLLASAHRAAPGCLCELVRERESCKYADTRSIKQRRLLPSTSCNWPLPSNYTYLTKAHAARLQSSNSGVRKKEKHRGTKALGSKLLCHVLCGILAGNKYQDAIPALGFRELSQQRRARAPID